MSNIPFYFGLNEDDLRDFLTIKAAEKKGVPFDIGIREIAINAQAGNAIIEFFDKLVTEFVETFDGEKMLGQTVRFKRIATEKGFNHSGSIEDILKESAQVSAQAAAMVIAQINKTIGGGAQLTFDSDFSQKEISRIIKISQVFDRSKIMTKDDFQAIFDDMEEELVKHGDLERIKIIRNGEEMVGAEVGSVFAVFPNEKEAESAMRALRGRIYDGREIKVIFIP